MKRQNGDADRLKNLARKNVRLAKRLDKGRSLSALLQLRDLTLNFGFSLASGELLHLNGGWYVTHSALLRLACRKRCAGITVEQVDQSSDPLAGRWVFKATVFKSPSSMGFVGYGDADPSNVSSSYGGRNACCRDSRRQPRLAQSVWDRALLGRGIRLTAAHRSASIRRKGSSPRRMAMALPMASPDCGTSSAS